MSERQPKILTQKEAMEKATNIMKQIMREIPNHKVYFTMKEMNLKRIRTITVDYMRACLAIHACRFPITSFWVSRLLDKDPYMMVPVLHGLGDKNCLTLKRTPVPGRGGAYEWIIHPIFLRYYNGEQNESESN